jgi:hypothetical protein
MYDKSRSKLVWLRTDMHHSRFFLARDLVGSILGCSVMFERSWGAIVFLIRSIKILLELTLTLILSTVPFDAG